MSMFISAWPVRETAKIYYHADKVSLTANPVCHL